jgi:hypothetical protein
MKSKTSLIALIGLIIFSCNTSSEDKVLPDTEVAALSTDPNVLQECFEKKMEVWYLSFNKYQDEGLDMHAADLKAVDQAEKVFQSCQKSFGVSIAESPESGE